MYTKPDKGWLCARTAFVCWIFLMWACVTYFFMCVLVWVCIAACDLLSTSYPLASSWPGAFPANQVWVCCQQVSSAHCEIHQSDGAHRTARQQHLSLFLSLPFYSFPLSTAQTQTHTHKHTNTRESCQRHFIYCRGNGCSCWRRETPTTASSVSWWFVKK